MAVLVEGISVISRTEAIFARYLGLWSAFCADIPNRTLTYDSEVAGVSFMTSDDTQSFIDRLAIRGLILPNSGFSADVAVVHQLSGIQTPCDWLEFGRSRNGLNRLAFCRMVGTECRQIFTPEGWKFEGSVSQSHTFVSSGNIARSMDFVDHRSCCDIYRSRLTDRLVYVPRAGGEYRSLDPNRSSMFGVDSPGSSFTAT